MGYSRKMSKIGFTCGAFDLLHAGHIVMLKEAKENCDYLIVGLQTDPSIDRKKKNKPIQVAYSFRLRIRFRGTPSFGPLSRCQRPRRATNCSRRTVPSAAGIPSTSSAGP